MSGPARFKNRVKISERHGAGEWAAERVALVALLPLAVWLASTAFTLAGAGYEQVMDWFASPLNAGLLTMRSRIACTRANISASPEYSDSSMP